MLDKNFLEFHVEVKECDSDSLQKSRGCYHKVTVLNYQLICDMISLYFQNEVVHDLFIGAWW